ncbi:hypothetical protein RNZ50_13645 [Paracoccaceae bacterium Fryx2]|nr:hypothetical protein [Paracoccaceae bacterium Fryx2]
MGKAIPQPASEAAPVFDVKARSQLQARLRGIDHVRVRLLGPDRTTALEVVTFLTEAGFEVEFDTIAHMVPVPVRRFVLQFSGRTATLTLAPHIVVESPSDAMW